ncbi:hypothetical protein MKEN_00342000 [Mycena kentingensis (nom. inval.)]|nr:hypothetical protein MKEN_00342000 [Mycena kentingensis (nom. inval.)]
MSISASSVASTASAGASLSRRPRTRTRSKTASASPAADTTSFPLPPSPNPVPFVAEPAEMSPRESRYPAAMSRVPSIPNDLAGGGGRDSVYTTGSGFTGGSSSIYPPSSTASGTESPPSPRSLAEQLDNQAVSSFDPEAEHEYDGDDVSYRLRLLVKNNYFLPPAHAKPSPSDLAASDTLKRAAKSPTTPNFFDLFKRSRSKSRSKPSTPTGGPHQPFDLTVPALRNSDVASPYGSQETRGRTSTQTPRSPNSPPDPSGRVVVVRERMPDIATAAKQAEQEMKARGAAISPLPRPSPVDVVDPTDAVDLPPPSAAYPFAVQASALHDMGVQDSVGAAALADRLPPPCSPGGLSANENWRKDLLHAAVNYSLNNSTEVLTSPQENKDNLLASPTTLASTDSTGKFVPPRPPRSPNRTLSPGFQIGQRITSALPSDEGSSSASTSRAEDAVSQPEESPRGSVTIPSRVETPSMQFTPLTPPPRKLVNPIYSISQTSLPLASAGSTDGLLEPAPRLSESYEVGVRHGMLSPPLIRREPDGRTSLDTDTTSFYSDQAGDVVEGRASISSSSRPSLTLSAQPSPTRSAFRDALDTAPAVERPPRSSSLRGSVDFPSCPSPGPIPRDSMASPPPRVSSSLAHFTPLSPPPRFGQRFNRAPPPISLAMSIPDAPEILAPSPTSPPLPTEQVAPQPNEPVQILAPPPSTPPFPHFGEPSSPPFPILGRRGASPLALSIPRQFVDAGPRSAPPVTSFFDSVHNQPNAMDDLDSSDEDDSDDDLEPPPATPVFMHPQTRAIPNVPPPPPSFNSSSRSLFMRLGNHSTPYVSRSSDGEDRKPVGNTPKSNAFFTERRSEQGHGPPTSSFEFYRYAKPKRSPTEAGPSNAPQTAISAKELESRRRLDGMLIQHMEAERASIRRITTSMSTNAKKVP